MVRERGMRHVGDLTTDVDKHYMQHRVLLFLFFFFVIGVYATLDRGISSRRCNLTAT